MPEIEALTARLGDGVVELREIAEWDIPEILIAHQNDPQLYRRLGYHKPPTGAQLGRQIELADDNRRSGRQVSLTIVELGSDWCRGRVDVYEFDWDGGVAKLGIWVDSRFRRRGYGTHALTLASDWLFERVGISRLELRTGLDNVAMRRAATVAGYVERIVGDEVDLVLERQRSTPSSDSAATSPN